MATRWTRRSGAWLADHAERWREGAGAEATGPGGARRRLRAIAVDGKALKGSAHLDRRHRHLLSALDQDAQVTLAQVAVEAKTNETAGFRPLLAPLELAGTVITFDALHTVKDQVK